VAKWKIAYFIYNFCVCVAVLLALPYFIIRNLILRRPILPYFFNLSRMEVEILKDKQVVWIQAVSVGETMVAESIIRELKKLQPDLQIVFTTTTPTGYQVAKQRLHELALVTYFPLELPFFMKRLINKIHPLLLIMIESELWPNAIRYSKEAGAKVALVNGRISDRSYQNYLRISGFVKMVFQQIDLLAMQSVEDANRIGTIGAPLTRIMVTGNAKFDQEYPCFNLEQLESFCQQYHFKKENLIFTAASTHRGEEEIIIQAYLDLLKVESAYLILAPRHPERAAEVATLLQQSQLSYTMRSSRESVSECSVLLLDTFGELGLAYAVADVVLVGGSLIKMKGIAGHNVLEAAAQEKPVLYGPYMGNFRESKRLLEEVDAGFTVHDAPELTKTIQDVTRDRALYQRRAKSAKAAVMTNRGASQQTAGFINDLLRSNSGE
jgi:3-deoxy-D-manno-octulosonic-acid transferase